MHLSITTLTILEQVTRDADGAAQVQLALRGRENSIALVMYPRGGTRIKLRFNDDNDLTPECNDKILSAIRADDHLTARLNEVLLEGAEPVEPQPHPHRITIPHDYVAPPTMLL